MKRAMTAQRERARGLVEDELRRGLLRALGVDGRPFRLEAALEGTRSLVFFLDVLDEDRGARFVVKASPEPWRALAAVSALRHMTRRGAPVPALRRAWIGPLVFARTRLAFWVEERAPGCNLYEIGRNEHAVRAAARALARLHAIRRAKWGALAEPLGRRHGYMRDQLRRTRRRLEDLASRFDGFGVLRDDAIGRWFAERAEAVRARAFSLCHMRISSTNVLVDEAGGARLIDVVTARYGHGAHDLERAYHRWAGRRPDLRQALLDEYFECAQWTSPDEWERERPFFHASYHLTQAYRAAKELDAFLDRGAFDKARARRRVLKRHVRALFGTIASCGDGSGEWRRLRAQALEAVRALPRPWRREGIPPEGDGAPPGAAADEEAES